MVKMARKESKVILEIKGSRARKETKARMERILITIN